MSAQARFLSTALRWLSRAIVLLTIAFLFIPVIVTVVLSFSNQEVLQFPPREYGPRQYEAFVGSPYWTAAVGKALSIAFPTALLATLVGLPAVFAFNRTKMPFREGLELAGLSPIVLPSVGYAIAMYAMYAQLRLLGTPHGLILADTAIAMPFVIIIVGAAIKRVPRDLELVAMSLGASRRRAFIGITMRLMLPAMAAGFVLAFISAFDEATFVTFTGGPALVPLPKAFFDPPRLGVEPLITAIATILMIMTGLAMTAAVWLR